MRRREVILADFVRASSACLLRALLLPSVTSSNLGCAIFIIFHACLLVKKNLNIHPIRRRKTRHGNILHLVIRYESTHGKKIDGTKPNQIGNTVGEKTQGKLTEESGQGRGLQSAPAVTFNMPTSYQKRVWEREAHINWSMATCQGSTRSQLVVYWPCASGLSAVNANGMQLRDPINSGLTRWRMAVSNKLLDAADELGRKPVSKHQIKPEYGDEQTDAGRDYRTRLVRPNS